MQAAPLPVRYHLLRDILEDGQSDDFLALQRNLRKHRPRRKLLADQKPDGLWAIDGSFAGLKDEQIQTLQLLKQMEVLHELLTYAVTSQQEKAKLGMREILRRIAEPLPGLRLHHETQAVFLAIRYDLEGNPIVKQRIREIIASQNKDGGWSSLAADSQSCYWSTLFLVWTLGQSKLFHTNRALPKALSYLESGLLEEGRSTLLPGMQAWDTLISGTSGLSILSGGTLRYLETLQLFPAREKDRRTQKLLDWLADIQLKTGLWPSIVGRDKQGDHAVTLRVLTVFKHYEAGKRVRKPQPADPETSITATNGESND